MTTWGDERGVVALPDGRRVRGTGLRTARGDVPPPDFAVFLLARDPGPRPWPHRWVRWPDFRLPASPPDALAVLAEAHQRAGEQRVELACRGGVGRTGTALAALAVLSGLPSDDAVAWVRRVYHPRSVETRAQRRWVETCLR